MKPKLTPEQKQEKLARDQLRYITNKVRGEWATSRLKTLGDLFLSFGYDRIKDYSNAQLLVELDWPMVKEFLDDRQIELNTYFYLKHNPPKNEWSTYDEERPADITAELHPVLSNAIRLDKEPKQTFDVARELAATEYAKRLPNLERRKAFLFWFQKKAIVEIIDNITQGHPANLLVAATGAGKTFINGDVIAWLLETKWTEGKTYSPWPIVYVTKASVVEQTRRVLEQFWSITDDECIVINIEQLRATFGERFIKEEIFVQDGIEHKRYVWRHSLKPVVIIWDECQTLKNYSSEQHKIAVAYNEEGLKDQKTYQLFVSATPGTRVAEFKCFCVATGVPYDFGISKGQPLSNAHWSDFASNIASDYGKSDIEPEDHSPAAIDRLMNYMDKYIVRVKGIRPQFKAVNKIEMIHFETEKGAKEYHQAWEKFMEEKAKIEGDSDMTNAQATFNILAQLTVFLKAAESNFDRINIICRRMVHDVMEGYATCAAVRNKLTICKCVEQLITKHGVKRNEISLIWGGAPKESKKQKINKKMLNNKTLMDIFEQEGISMDDIDMDEMEDIQEVETYPKEWRLGPQNAKQRQEEIDRYQRGESLYCFYTFRAGGVGLSLHHTDEFTTRWNISVAGFEDWHREVEEWNAKQKDKDKLKPGKVRHKESGYAFEQDIAYIPTRPRRNYCSPTWSAIELVQGVGRCPRLTSLSDTHQIMLFFLGTVEERQAVVVSVKLHCLTKVVRNKESWEDLIIGRKGMSDAEIENAHIKDAVSEAHKEIANKEDEDTQGVYLEEEEEE